jgi:HlyD family secretion protein
MECGRKGARMACDTLMRIIKPVLAIVLMAAVFACTEGPRNVYQGYIEGDYLYISSPVGGTVTNIPAIKGMRVKTGTLLFELDPEPESSAYQEAMSQLQAAQALYEDKTKGLRTSELAAIEASIRQAQAALSFSRKEYDRLKALYQQKIIAQDRLDSAKSTYDRDRAAVAELRAQLKTAGLGARYDQIEAARKNVEQVQAAVDKAEWALNQKKDVAPTDGLVVDVLYTKGEFVPSGYPVVQFLPPGKVRVRFFVSEPKLSTIKTGQKVNVFLDGRPSPIVGTISYIAPEAEYTPPFIYSKDNRKKLVFLVEASFEPAVARNLNPGQPVEVRLSP